LFQQERMERELEIQKMKAELIAQAKESESWSSFGQWLRLVALSYSYFPSDNAWLLYAWHLQ
jgi:hypothetical protein